MDEVKEGVTRALRLMKAFYPTWSLDITNEFVTATWASAFPGLSGSEIAGLFSLWINSGKELPPASPNALKNNAREMAAKKVISAEEAFQKVRDFTMKYYDSDFESQNGTGLTVSVEAGMKRKDFREVWGDPQLKRLFANYRSRISMMLKAETAFVKKDFMNDYENAVREELSSLPTGACLEIANARQEVRMLPDDLVNIRKARNEIEREKSR